MISLRFYKQTKNIKQKNPLNTDSLQVERSGWPPENVQLDRINCINAVVHTAGQGALASISSCWSAAAAVEAGPVVVAVAAAAGLHSLTVLSKPHDNNAWRVG